MHHASYYRSRNAMKDKLNWIIQTWFYFLRYSIKEHNQRHASCFFTFRFAGEATIIVFLHLGQPPWQRDLAVFLPRREQQIDMTPSSSVDMTHPHIHRLVEKIHRKGEKSPYRRRGKENTKEWKRRRRERKRKRHRLSLQLRCDAWRSRDVPYVCYLSYAFCINPI